MKHIIIVDSKEDFDSASAHLILEVSDGQLYVFGGQKPLNKQQIANAILEIANGEGN